MGGRSLSRFSLREAIQPPGSMIFDDAVGVSLFKMSRTLIVISSVSLGMPACFK